MTSGDVRLNRPAQVRLFVKEGKMRAVPLMGSTARLLGVQSTRVWPAAAPRSLTGSEYLLSQSRGSAAAPHNNLFPTMCICVAPHMVYLGS